MLEVLQTLQLTPVPNFLVVAGVTFFFLAAAGRFGSAIEISSRNRRWAGVLGIICLIAGIWLYILPLPSTTPIGIVSFATETPTSIISSPEPPTPTSTLELPETPIAELVNTGNLKFEYPFIMTVGEADTLSLEIVASQALTTSMSPTDFITGVINIESSSKNGTRIAVKDVLRIYPVMSAKLIADSNVFDIHQGDDDARRFMGITRSALWTWSLSPKALGMHKVTLNIFGEIQTDDAKFLALESSKTRDIQVIDKSFQRRILEGLRPASGFWTIFGSIVGTNGPFALLIIFLTYRANKTKEELNQKVKDLETELEIVLKGCIFPH